MDTVASRFGDRICCDHFGGQRCAGHPQNTAPGCESFPVAVFEHDEFATKMFGHQDGRDFACMFERMVAGLAQPSEDVQ